MVDVLGLVPTSLGGIIGLLVQVIIIWVVVMLADKVIAHQIEAKHSLILAVLAYFLTPLVLSLAAISIPFAGIIIPLIVWVVLGQVLLRQTVGFVPKVKVAAVAFVLYLVLTYAGVPSMFANLIGF